MLSDIESNYKWTKTWAKPLKIDPCGYLGKLNNGFLYSFLGEQFVATMKSNSSKVAMTSHVLLHKMHFIPGGFWGLCVCYDTSGSRGFWVNAGRYVNVGTLTDGNHFASFATTITGEINDIKCPGRPQRSTRSNVGTFVRAATLCASSASTSGRVSALRMVCCSFCSASSSFSWSWRFLSSL